MEGQLDRSTPFTGEGWIEGIFRKVVPGGVEEAWREVIMSTAYLSEADRQMALEGKPVFRKPKAYVAGLSIDNVRRVVAIQGAWWYRGVTCVEADAGGSLVTHVVVNVAPIWTRWLAHIFQARAVRKNARAQAGR